MNGISELLFAVLGPCVAILADRLTVGSNESFIENGCKRVVKEHNATVAATSRLSSAHATLLTKTARSCAAAVGLLPSLVAGATAIYGTVFGLLRTHPQAQATMLAVTIILILLMTLRPLWYVMTYSLYDLHNLAKEEIPKRYRGNPDYRPPTYLERVQQVPMRVNLTLIVLALAAFGWNRASGRLTAVWQDLKGVVLTW